MKADTLGFRRRYQRRNSTHHKLTKFESYVIATFVTTFGLLGIEATITSVALLIYNIIK
jgi:hypothetical protein